MPTTSLHKDLVPPEIHQPISFIYADETARLAASGFVTADEGKWARQLDDNSVYMLIDATTPEWKAISTPAHAGGMKSGLILPGAFSGNPRVTSVNFVSAFPDTNYSITVDAETLGDWRYDLIIYNKAASGFDLSLGTNRIANLVKVGWQAIPQGE